MLIFPVLFYLVLGFIPVSEEIRMTMSLITAMPTMSSVVMLANSSGSDGEYSLGGVMLTTLCGIVRCVSETGKFQDEFGDQSFAAKASEDFLIISSHSLITFINIHTCNSFLHVVETETAGLCLQYEKMS